MATITPDRDHALVILECTDNNPTMAAQVYCAVMVELGTPTPYKAALAAFKAILRGQ